MIKISKENEFNLESIFGKKKLEKWIKKYLILINKDIQRAVSFSGIDILNSEKYIAKIHKLPR